VNAPLIFLDIDGVLNNHVVLKNGINSIDRQNVEQLNILIRATDARVVISSAWRYMILGGAMTLEGFRYMLMAHGLTSEARIVGHTCSDEAMPERGDQIALYLATEATPAARKHYVILDDGSELPQGDNRTTMSQSLTGAHGYRWVLVDGSRGLTAPDVEKAVAILDGRIHPVGGGR